MPKFSIILPIYNVENYLPRCFKYLFGQTFSDIEIICVNDGSTDNSLSILKNYAQNDNRIKLISQENKGVSAARNAGMNAATGEYILFVDPDDYLDKNACQILVDIIEKYEDVELLLFNHLDIFPDKNTLVKQNYNQEIKSKILEKVIDFVAKPTIYCLWVKLFKTDIIKRNKIRFNENLSWAEDAYFVWQYYKCNPITVTIPNVLYYYTCAREGSLSTDIPVKFFEKFKKAFAFFKQILFKNIDNYNQTICECYILDRLMIETLFQWKYLYFTEYKDEYVSFVKEVFEFYPKSIIENHNFLGYARAKRWLGLSKCHINWFYWKMIFPICKYCFVMPYRKLFKRGEKVV